MAKALRKSLQSVKAPQILPDGVDEATLEQAETVAETLAGTDIAKQYLGQILVGSTDAIADGITKYLESLAAYGEGIPEVEGADGKQYRLFTLNGPGPVLTGRRLDDMQALIDDSVRIFLVAISRDLVDADGEPVLQRNGQPATTYSYTDIPTAINALLRQGKLQEFLGLAYGPIGERYHIEQAKEYGEAIYDSFGIKQRVGVLYRFFSPSPSSIARGIRALMSRAVPLIENFARNVQ